MKSCAVLAALVALLFGAAPANAKVSVQWRQGSVTYSGKTRSGKTRTITVGVSPYAERGSGSVLALGIWNPTAMAGKGTARAVGLFNAEADSLHGAAQAHSALLSSSATALKQATATTIFGNTYARSTDSIAKAATFFGFGKRTLHAHSSSERSITHRLFVTETQGKE